ncbi:MAG: hypothetical protein V4608_02095 [Bacteroidota bacterium]
MKKILFKIVLFVPFSILGQQVKLSADFKVSTSTPFEVVDAGSKEYVGVEKDLSISIKTRGEMVTVQKFNVSTMKEVKRNVYEDLPKYTKVQNVIKVGERVYYVFEAFNKKEKNYTVYSREVDIANGTFKEIKTLFTTQGEVASTGYVAAGFMGFSSLPKFDVISSFDGSKILIRFRNKPESRNDSKNFDELGFYVFDNTFTKIWGKEVKMPHTEKEMDNLAYTVNNEGTAFMLSRINANKSFELITVSNSEGLKNKVLPVKKGMMFDKFELRESSNGNILAAGYYANGIDTKVDWTGNMSQSRNINGLYVFELGKDGSVVRDNDYPFSIELIKKYLSMRQKDKADAREEDGKAGINDLVLRNFVLNSDGSMVIIGEIFYSKKEMWFTSMEMVSHFGDMVATKIDAKGKLVWSEKMPKNQAVLSSNVEDLRSLGIAYVQGKGAHYILFVDNRKNATLKMDQPAEPHKGGFGGYLTAYKIDDATGKVEKHSILDLTNIGGKKAYQFSLTRIFEAKDKTFMLETYIKDKQDMMIKMELVK